nr:hypothetical protein [Mycoplasmopsis bovis]
MRIINEPTAACFSFWIR